MATVSASVDVLEFTERNESKQQECGSSTEEEFKQLKAMIVTKLCKTQNTVHPESTVPSASIYLLDIETKKAIESLSSKSFQIKNRMQSLQQHSQNVQSSKTISEKSIYSVCKELIQLIEEKKESLLQYIHRIQQAELQKIKLLNERLNLDMCLVQETKSKCESMISVQSIHDIWSLEPETLRQNPSEESIVSVIQNCLDILDTQALAVQHTNVFDTMRCSPYNKEKAQELVSQNMNLSHGILDTTEQKNTDDIIESVSEPAKDDEKQHTENIDVCIDTAEDIGGDNITCVDTCNCEPDPLNHHEYYNCTPCDLYPLPT